MFKKRTPPSPTPSRSARSSTKIDSLVSVVEQKYASSALKKEEEVKVAPHSNDPIVENIVFLREEMANDDNFYEFLDQFSKLTDRLVTYDEYQNSVKSLILPHLVWRVNSLIKSIVDVVEVNGSPVKISRELKLPSISELLENCTISTPDASFYKSETTTNAETPTTTLVRATSQRTLAFQQLIGGYMANFAVASDEEVAERPVKTPRNSLEQGHPATPRGSLEQLPPPPTSPSTEESSPSEDAGSDDDEFSDKKKKKSRVRNEWTSEEDKVFLEGLKTYGLDFSAIAKMLPSRSRYQIRTHYAYLAKSIRANEKSNQNGEVPYRRLKTRGRPPKGGAVNAMPNELLCEITECIRNLEVNQKKVTEQEQTSSRGSI
jgi:hypothetical protein